MVYWQGVLGLKRFYQFDLFGLRQWVQGTSPVPDEHGPVCGTISDTYAVLGTVSIEGCEGATNMIALGNDIPILLTGAQDESDDSYINDATVEFTLYARNGTTVLAGPTTMDYVTASNGNYRGILESSVIDPLVAAVPPLLEPGLAYPVKVTLVDDDLDAEWWQNIPVGRRGWNC